MLVLGLLLLAGYLAFLFWEKQANDRALRSFRHVIHVSGIRGKTGVCRLLDAHLRGAGLRVFTKTTGSVPAYIDTEGVEHTLDRRGMANIGEQLAMIRRASREGAEVLILECMAVQPELQRVSQRDMVRGDVNVITNVRYDHSFEMGETLEEIAGSLSAVIPAGGALFTADEEWFPYFQERCQALGSKAFLCRSGDEERTRTRPSPGRWARTWASRRRPSPDHIRAYQQDFGARHLYRQEQRAGVCEPVLRQRPPVHPDAAGAVSAGPGGGGAAVQQPRRPAGPAAAVRAALSPPHPVPEGPVVMGEARGLACRLLRRSGLPVEAGRGTGERRSRRRRAPPWWAFGNIKGQAADMVAYFERGGGARRERAGAAEPVALSLIFHGGHQPAARRDHRALLLRPLPG